jgi:UDP-4-amino-4,6-dideoxy-N-acetyl-beta-L-altrosamine transaminase
MKPIPYGRQNITLEDIDAVINSLQSEYLTQGPKINEFENAFAEYVGCKYALSVSNGTAALHLSALALDVKKGANVITTPITFVASANCVRYCGGNVFFSDINPLTSTLDLKKVEALILSKPKGFFKGIIPVDFAGYAVNLEEFRNLANKYDLWIIEDACHAPGGFFIDSTGKKQRCGNSAFADLAIFSFHPVKHITCGEGGMITTNDKKLYNKLLKLRTHGITKESELLLENHGGWYYEMQELGYNYRLTDFQAALGVSQLKRANDGINIRRKIAKKYFDSFKSNSKIIGQTGVIDGHAYHLYIIQVKERRKLYNFLKSKNILCQVHYIPAHLMPYYQNLGWKKGDFPVSENYYENCLSLPMYSSLTDLEQEKVINEINHFLIND